MTDPVFLDIEDVLLIHEEQLPRYGGSPGIRDRALLESAVAMPRATAGGEFAHEDVFAMAAAYAFHIAQNQPLRGSTTPFGWRTVRCSSTWGIVIRSIARTLPTLLLVLTGACAERKPDVSQVRREERQRELCPSRRKHERDVRRVRRRCHCCAAPFPGRRGRNGRGHRAAASNRPPVVR